MSPELIAALDLPKGTPPEQVLYKVLKLRDFAALARPVVLYYDHAFSNFDGSVNDNVPASATFRALLEALP